ncbi:von Willebrand factor A domain-containing protein 7-like isoform X2 [Denticeps clupeoides]|nr:von Willebrand factor A domain-containing protein 7-like isoform X2 [Denticeps clupeoides]
MSSAWTLALLALMLAGQSQGFVTIDGSISTHTTITATAMLNKITEVCKAVAESENREFRPTGSSPEELLTACLGTATGLVSAAKFRTAHNQIYMKNSMVDRDFANSPPHHVNSEAFIQARSLIAEGMTSVKANIEMKNFQAARETLGRVCHTVQDFYSHSNWVELGNTGPYTNLIRPDLPIGNLADIDTATCSDCSTGTCSNPILPSIINEKKLTSGYMGLFSAEKPKGKCSHGGAADLTSTQVPRGGISKDERHPHNAVLHDKAVNAAIQATLQLLEDIRGASGNQDFLRLMGIARSSVLSFVIDTTGSMSDDIAEAKRVANNIIDTKKGTQDEPSEYILVPFNDPAFGPLIRTTDPEKMKSEISRLIATGGGDEPEMCLSGLQLALTGAPSSSNIYVFTDATAKDEHLEPNIFALIKSTKSTVSFLLTTTMRSTRSIADTSRSAFRLYYDLALASGGETIEVSKTNLPQATDIIVDTSTSALVTVVQRDRNPGTVETFSFLLDDSLSNVTAYITGTSLTFTLISPSGLSQQYTNPNGPLGTIQTVGNLYRIRLNMVNITGLWKIDINSKEAYTLKVTGQSATTFIYDFVEKFQGAHPGYAVITGLPQAGMPTMLLLSLTGQNGPANLKVREAALIQVSGSTVSDGKVEEMGGGDYLVTVNSVPSGEFVVLLKGEDISTSSQFQRQSTTQMSVSKVSINAVVDRNMEPGQNFKMHFTVSNNVTGTKFTIRASNDRNFEMKSSSSITSTGSGMADGLVDINVPANTPSGTDVTLTIEAEVTGTTDSNFAVLRLSVVKNVTEFTPPTCEVIGVNNTCQTNCSWNSWDLTVNITDGNGTGVDKIWIQQGSADLIYSSTNSDGVKVYKNTYRSSCCSPNLQLSVTDKEGNVGTCFYSIRVPTAKIKALTNTPNAGPPSLGLATQLWAFLLISVVSVVQDFL